MVEVLVGHERGPGCKPTVTLLPILPNSSADPVIFRGGSSFAFSEWVTCNERGKQEFAIKIKEKVLKRLTKDQSSPRSVSKVPGFEEILSTRDALIAEERRLERKGQARASTWYDLAILVQ